MSSLVGPDEDDPRAKPPVPQHVQDAIRTLIEWTGDDPSREGLLDTPKRVARAWKEYCVGYEEDPAQHLGRVFEEVGGYNEIVLLKDIPFQSHCEHHMAPIIGKPPLRICRTIGWSAFRSLRVSFTVSRVGFRFRNASRPKSRTASGIIFSLRASPWSSMRSTVA